MSKLPFILGPLLILAGGWMILLFVGFSTMVEPDLEGWARWRKILTQASAVDLSWLAVGVVLVAAGFRVAASGGRGRETPHAVNDGAGRDGF
ncbi:hypothetical protein OJF2_03510 [Aquisphaera giovannonii]|uniref:Uncharacterized protein n=1 Tax=Aquisphaera giovannonii TaxID=406548 RepID=A0A5B9VUX6_9BACT|nr:hypothetical protein [Aquisphaera giovannonii]QEH31884.1 hypothetical protein OJF2_03510 [Aquisphaera giovannonii]